MLRMQRSYVPNKSIPNRYLPSSMTNVLQTPPFYCPRKLLPIHSSQKVIISCLTRIFSSIAYVLHVAMVMVDGSS
jgi:hypothetical protein